jgi:hypothetical protein
MLARAGRARATGQLAMKAAVAVALLAVAGCVPVGDRPLQGGGLSLSQGAAASGGLFQAVIGQPRIQVVDGNGKATGYYLTRINGGYVLHDQHGKFAGYLTNAEVALSRGNPTASPWLRAAR